MTLTVTSGSGSALTHFSPTSSSHLPVAYEVLFPFKRSRASLTSDPTQSDSSVSLAPPSQSPSKVTSVISEGNDIRRKFSIMLTRQREPQHARTHLREHPQSISSIGSLCASSPQSQASQSPQSNSLPSLQTVVAVTGNSSHTSSVSRGARVDPSAAMTSSSFVDAAAVVAIDDRGALCVTVPDINPPTVAALDKTNRMMTMTRRTRGDSSQAFYRRKLLQSVREGGRKMLYAVGCDCPLCGLGRFPFLFPNYPRLPLTPNFLDLPLTLVNCLCVNTLIAVPDLPDWISAGLSYMLYVTYSQLVLLPSSLSSSSISPSFLISSLHTMYY